MDQKTFDIIERISQEHCNKIFGYLDKNDLKNEIWQICLEKMSDFTPDRGELEHFLRVSVKNRLINRFKDIAKSVRSPCPRCIHYRPYNDITCAKFGEEKSNCSKWHNYQLSIKSRNSLLNVSEKQKDITTSENTLNKLAGEELKSIIEKELKPQFLYDFQQLISNGKLSKQKLKKLKKEILRILDKKNQKELVKVRVNGKDI